MNKLYKQYREYILYIIFGVLTVIISISTFAFFTYIIYLNEIFANMISWVFAVMFAYITNRTWVFKSKAKNFKELVKEMLSFWGGRVFTLIFENLFLFIFITRLNGGRMIVKVIASILVIIMNYIISKVFVFRK